MATPNKRLETARMRKRWSIAVASEKAGVSINTFNRWERGLQVPQLSTLDLVCKAFDMSPEDLGFEHAIVAKRRSPHTPEDTTTPVLPPYTFSSFIPSSIVQDNIMTTVQQPKATVTRSIADMKRTHRDQSGSGNNSNNSNNSNNNGNGSDQSVQHTEVSRRHVIATLIGAPALVFRQPKEQTTSMLHPAEIVSLCEVSIPLSWRLYFEGGLNEVHQSLPGYLKQLTQLTQEPSPYQKKATILASQGYQLASLLSSQYQNFGTAATYSAQAFTFAEQVSDPYLQTAALIRQALVSFYLKRSWQRLHAYERALQYSQHTSPLLQGRVHIGLSETHSHLGHAREAAYHLELAHKIFPTRCEDDPSFPYTHFNHESLLALEGITHLHLNHPRQAWESFSQMSNQLTTHPVPNRLELTVHQAMASYKLNDRDQTCAYLEAALHSTLTANNQLRYNEACDIYQLVRRKWTHEKNVKALGELFAHNAPKYT